MKDGKGSTPDGVAGDGSSSGNKRPRQGEEEEPSLAADDSDGSNATLPKSEGGAVRSASQSQNGGVAEGDGKLNPPDGDEKDGGAAAEGGSQAKRQKVEQLTEVPLLVPAAVARDTKASLLVHLRDENLDFSGDTGAVGRIAVGGKKKGRGLTFDLKGQQFSGQILPSATVLVVGVGRTEAKVEGIFSEVCRLDHTRDVLEFMGGEVLKGEMDDSYRFEEEDVNARGGGGGDGGGGNADSADQKGGGGRTPKTGRKTSTGKKKGSTKGSSSSSSSAKKGSKASGGKAKK